MKIVSSPNERLLVDLFASLNIRSMVFNQPSITHIDIGTEDGLSLPIFSSRIRSNYYEDLVAMGTAKRFPERKALPESFLNQIRSILLANSEYSQACLEIARATGYKISGETVKKYIGRIKE